MVPPVINKYYIMDIAPGRSMIEYFVQQGQQVFAISWRNPQARHRIGASIPTARRSSRHSTRCRRSPAPTAPTCWDCSGGILAAMTAAHLAEIGEGDRIAGLTLAVTVLDQSRAGFAVGRDERTRSAGRDRRPAKKGYLDGRALAEMFAWLRPTDLVWRYWVNNYVQGRPPAAFDVLFWNADTTRMAAALHRDMVLMGCTIRSTTPGAVSMLGTPVDLSKVTADLYVIGGIADHICPWQATYRSAGLLGSKDNRFVLSTSGHIAALVNPPGNPKASFRAGQSTPRDPDEWLATGRDSCQDSWWPDYVAGSPSAAARSRRAENRLVGRAFPRSPRPRVLT